MPKLYSRANASTAKKTLRIYKKEIAKNKKLFWIYTIAIPANRLLNIVLLPLLFSFVLQSLITEPHNWKTPAILLGVASLFSILALISARIGFSALFYHEERMQTTLLETAMRNLSAHSDQFFASRKVGALAGDVTKFSHSIVSFLDTIFLNASSLVINFVASLVVVAVLSPVLLIPLGIVTGLIVWTAMKGTARRGPIRHKRKTLMSRLTGIIADIIGNQQIVRYFATEDRELEHIRDERRKIETIARKEIDIIENESLKRQSVLFFFQIATLAICVWLYAINSITIAALIFTVTYLGRLTSSLFDISPIIRNTEQAFLDAADITEILDEQPEVIDDSNAQTLNVSDGNIVFDKVYFAYHDSPNENVIDNFNISIKAGEKVGLAGYSGGGKTTITKLILRFADVTKGNISIDGQKIIKTTQSSLRKNIAYVPQEAYLFHRTLRENVAYGRLDASDEEIIVALKRANAWEFVSQLKNGLDTIVGERGVKLSGGQRQRIAIARAILKDAPILVLDEATSALDSESEKLIQQSLEQLMKGRTSIVIAHRLSTIAKLDRIVVLDKGKIAEDGTHAELLKKNGIYAKLWSHQSGGFIDE
jgi:ATP-binding cassette subfamily B protein